MKRSAATWRLIPAEQRFWLKVNKGPGCWEWTGACNTAGYGLLRVDQRSRGAHRYSYELHVGPIPAGLIVCHRCDNRRCVNPAHLFVGTYQDNMDDMKAKGRGVITRPRAKLTDDQVREIRRAFARGDASQRQLARVYGVNQMAVSRLVRRETYGHVA